MKASIEQPFDSVRLRQRLDGYLMNHQIVLHTSVMSIALAVGGLALASLIGTAKLYRDQYPLLWMLWLASMLACFVVYNSVSSSAYALPSKIPSASDLIPPLVIGAFEFLLFAVLAHQATGLTHTSAVISAWFFSFAGFALTSVGALIRADYLFKVTRYETGLEQAIKELRRILHIDTANASGLAALALITGVSEITVQVPGPVLYVLTVAIILGLLSAPIGHAHRIAVVRRTLDGSQESGASDREGSQQEVGGGEQAPTMVESSASAVESKHKADRSHALGKAQAETELAKSEDKKAGKNSPQT